MLTTPGLRNRSHAFHNDKNDHSDPKMGAPRLNSDPCHPQPDGELQGKSCKKIEALQCQAHFSRHYPEAAASRWIFRVALILPRSEVFLLRVVCCGQIKAALLNMTFSPIPRFNSLRVRHNQLSPLSTKVNISYFHSSAESSIDICQRTILRYSTTLRVS